MLADERGTVSKAYGATMPLIPMSARKLFLIDKAGVVQAIVDGMPDHAPLLDLLDRLNATSEKPVS